MPSGVRLTGASVGRPLDLAVYLGSGCGYGVPCFVGAGLLGARALVVHRSCGGAAWRSLPRWSGGGFCRLKAYRPGQPVDVGSELKKNINIYTQGVNTREKGARAHCGRHHDRTTVPTSTKLGRRTADAPPRPGPRVSGPHLPRYLYHRHNTHNAQR